MDTAAAAVELIAIRPMLLYCAHRFGAGQAAEDVVQDALLRVWSRVGSIESAGLRNYTIRTVRNVMWDRKRRAAARFVECSLQALVADDSLAGLGECDRYDLPGPLSAAVADLAPPYRGIVECVARHAEAGSQYADVAEETGLPMGTVKSRLHRAREIVGKRLDREEARSWR